MSATREIRPRLKKIRKAKKLRQDRVAEDIGVGVSTLRGWESGGKGFEAIVKVIRLCRALGCSVEDLADID